MERGEKKSRIEEINYDRTEFRRDDDKFFKNEWRIFLGRNEEQWRTKREVIRLLDKDGRIVDVYTY